MKKLQFFTTALSLFFSMLYSTAIIAQQRAQNGVILKQGNYHEAWEIPGGGFGRCFCGQGAYDCLCGFVNYSDFEVPDMVPAGYIGVLVSSQVVSGNALQINFKEKLKMELKKNDFVQEEEVLINSNAAKSLGYKSIRILPGTYSIKDGNSLTLNIECGEPYKTRSWGWISFIVVLIILISVISGQSSAPSGSTTSQNCDDCKRDMQWFRGLPWWKKAIFHAWYITRWTICKARGCI